VTPEFFYFGTIAYKYARAMRVVARATAPTAAAFAARKKLCTGGFYGGVDGPGEGQNARIGANRFAPPGLRRVVFGGSRHSRAGEFRFHFDSRKRTPRRFRFAHEHGGEPSH
jgi:hypothetical protein